MTYSIDDVREGDVVTYEVGEPRTVGYVQRTVTIDNTEYNRVDRISRDSLNCRITISGARILDVQRQVIPSHAGALVFTDTGLAVCDGGDDYAEWACTRTRAAGTGSWDPEPDKGAEEALPVPAEPLRALLAAWDEMSDYQQRVWEGSSAPAPRVVVRNKIAAFIESTRAEWERAGITP